MKDVMALRSTFLKGLDSLEEEAAEGMERTVKTLLPNVSEACQNHMTLYLQTIFSKNMSRQSPFFKSKYSLLQKLHNLSAMLVRDLLWHVIKAWG